LESLHDLECLIDSGQRLITIETEQEGCFLEGFKRLAQHSHRDCFKWTMTRGLLRLAPGFKHQTLNKDINQLFGQILSTSRDSVFVLIDFHHFLEEPVAIRYIKDVLLNAPNQTIILLSKTIALPEDLEHLASSYSMPLPDLAEIRKMVSDLARRYKHEKGMELMIPDTKILEELLNHLCGMKMQDAQRIAKHAIYNDGVIDQTDIVEIAKRKFDLLNQDNVLSLELEYEALDKVAGFDNLKQWLSLRREIFKGTVELPGADKPKGMLLLGVQGCGKSLAAKAVAGSWHLPLLYLDFGTLYNRFFGQTEQNMRLALEIAEKMQPCVLWLDEIEKGMSANSSSDDVSKRLLGRFLTWLSENKASVFVVATANDVSKLPPELLRKGRFDEVFFVDLPSEQIRLEILKLHLAKRKLSLDNVDMTYIANLCEGFSGAEIEQLVVSAQYHIHAHNVEMTTELMCSLIKETKPLSVLMREQVLALQTWAKERAVQVH